jgi:glucan phosphoethanolaminetransferase (alkaline phosphatase superfamily)
MMRKITIVGAGLVGVLGLLMSLCGGGFFVMMGYDNLRAMFGTVHDPTAYAAMILLVIPAAFMALGAIIGWSCFKYVKRRRPP